MYADNVYGNIPKKDYLLGKFDPADHPDLFIEVRGIATNYKMYMRTDAYSSFMKMYSDFKNETGLTFHFISALRNYDSQRRIWNNKWEGEYSNIPQPINRALGILTWSSMPGTSRHHWGTDFDFFSLSNEDFDHGKGKIMYEWFNTRAAKYGFCQPFTHGRCAGYNEERWHWSFSPISKILLKDWNEIYGSKSICEYMSNVDFHGHQEAAILAPTYVNTVGAQCR